MRIAFSHRRGTPVLTCTRDDGTVTYSRSAHGPFFGPHDLMHYAVETTLGLRDSFFGLIQRGRGIPSFAEPGTAGAVPAEAHFTEHLVNLLLQEQASGTPAGVHELDAMLRRVTAGSRASDCQRAITDDELRRIRARFAELLSRYRSLSDGETMVLPFP